MNSILVTGGAGFIGSHTCLSLLKKGYQLYVIDSFINSSKDSLNKVLDTLKIYNIDAKKNMKIIVGDIKDKILLRKVFEESRKDKKPINSVIHFAGLKSVAESVRNPIMYWNANVTSSLNLFEIMIEFNCTTIVFSSSATIYGLFDKGPIKENGVIQPINPYGNTKYAIETLLKDIFGSNKNMKIANLRYFNPVGAHYLGLIGEDPKGIPNNIFPLITKVAVGKFDKLKIYGNDWPTRDGTGVRDYIHVMDLAEGHIRMLEFLLSNDPQILNVNLGTGVGTSVLELIETFKEVNNVDIPYEIVGRRSGDVAEIIADNNLAKELINWIPTKNLREICKDGFNWQINNPDGFQKEIN
tara:strand:- start:45 stop:1109 length:1065 start_codon:yes stop_codon:yes gene_type:complete